MAPEALRSPWARAFGIAALCLILATPAHALRVLNYNLLNYPGSSGPARNPHFRIILSQIQPDVLFAQEVISQAGTDAFLDNVLNVIEPGQWAALTFVNGNDTDGAMFYKPSKFALATQSSYYPNAANLLRLVHVYRLQPTGYTTAATEILFHSVHLKASDGTAEANQRFAEATGMRDSMNAMPPGTHAFGIGDFNFYRSTAAEPAYGKYMESQADNDGRLYDPLGLGNMTWNNNASMAQHHTQCPCNTGCINGSVGGAMDDRFDLILPTYNWNNGTGYELVPGTMKPFGNDGAHFNVAINTPPYTVIDSTTAYALWYASDHLPIYVDIQVPAIGQVAATLDLGSSIGAGSANLVISNIAVAPADGLTYSLTAPVGFSAPAGTFELAPGGAAVRVVSTSGAGFGPRAGNLTLNSDDLDQPVRSVALTANVLDHQHASLDSTTEQTVGALDFGNIPALAFTPSTVAVHNFGYSSAQARLVLNGATILGGDGHFSILSGDANATIADVGQRFEVKFDPAGATSDSTYTATLVFTGADEPLPGAAPAAPLTVTLSATVFGGVLAAPNGPAAPQLTQLYAPFPNPLSEASRIRFDLARAAVLRLEVLDLAGRRVTTLANSAFEPGRFSFTWSGRDEGGAQVPAGVYFVRMTGQQTGARAVRLAVVR